VRVDRGVLDVLVAQQFMTWGMLFVLWHSMVAFQWRSVVNVIFSSLGLLSLAATLLRAAGSASPSS